jgi:arabinan endo-1,5-alpha-L-arabinosidase
VTPYSDPAPGPVARRNPGYRLLIGAVAAICLLGGLAITALPSQAASYPNPGRVTGDTTGVHDPAMIKASNGTYILVSTNNYLEIRTSTDRVNFKKIGSVWQSGQPTWTYPYTKSDARGYLWAPDISYHNGQYYLYYAASSFGSNKSAIFLATSPTAMPGTWTHRGLVIETNTSSNYNAIDPNLIVDASGRWYLSLGSFWSGIKMIRIEPSTGLRHSDTTVRSIAQRFVNPYAIEAPFVYRHGSYYYLFMSFDLCCKGTKSTYRTMVGRSTSVTGTYYDKSGVALTSGGGTEILATHGTVYGPGHVAVMPDTDADVLIYHYYYSDSAPATGKLGINLLGWDSAGWPYVY